MIIAPATRDESEGQIIAHTTHARSSRTARLVPVAGACAGSQTTRDKKIEVKRGHTFVCAMGRSAPADFTGSQDRLRPANWAVQITVVTQLLERGLWGGSKPSQTA
eukprot:scaffold25621_cov36-Phaeocystis_antarctica.AAC.1